MGGKSRSTSTTQNFTDASTLNANLTGAAAGVIGDENITETTINTNILDAGAIDSAFDFGSESLDVLNDSVSESLSFSESVVNKGFDFSGDTVDSSFDVVGDTVDEGFDFGLSALNEAFGFGSKSFAFSEETLAQSFEFGAGSLDQAFAFSSNVAEQSSIENRAILNSAIEASNDAQSSVLGFAKSVATPQSEFIKAGVIGLAVLVLGGMFIRGRK